MIFGIGTDIIEIARVKKALDNPRFIERVYTEAEQAYCNGKGAQRAASYAVRWAGKEAVMKAFGTGLRNGEMRDIEILPDALGCPIVHLSGAFASLAAERGIHSLKVSLSHAHDFATAVCVAEGE